ncbi:cysteine-rich DPF motif domain-containing protein 1 isoform X2 [Panthera tigris]|uniref:cysteine-rich DPF motif domain-containing protein 1 isoform X2 n=1 Tax=Panthera tigris TaxID=9694 RepID=UPI001C6FC225|nr:cysteine-rich DPF motif domain-containing protein 1 isoform X2 [Panthera tigris]
MFAHRKDSACENLSSLHLNVILISCLPPFLTVYLHPEVSSKIPLPGWTTVYLSIHLLKDILVAPKFGQLCTELLYPAPTCRFCVDMECEADHRPLGVFKCQLCALTAPYSYVGQKPPDTQSVVLLEESYVMKDPFTSDKGRFLVLGSQCSLCSRLVCVGPECSLFYSKRFCLPCVRENIDAFPWEIRQDLGKRKDLSKKPASQPGSRT